MIITLKGADFSNSNVGTLSTWLITKSLKGVTTDNTLTSIDKENSGYTAVFVVNDGYSLSTAKVTMGGVDITSSLIWADDETSAILTIEEVTGNVVISIVAVSESGEEGGSDTTVTKYLFKDQTFIGYLRGGNYVESANSATTDYIDISSKPKIGYYGRMGYVEGDTFHALEFFDASKNYIDSLSVLGTGSPSLVNIDLSDSKYANAKYVRASVSQSSYTIDEFNTWYFVVGDYAEEPKSITDMFPVAEYINLDGTFTVSSSGAYRTDYVSTTGKTNISYKGRMGTIGLNIAFYDSSKTFISGLETIGNGNFVELNIDLTDSKYSSAAYVVASISKGSLTEDVWNTSFFEIS